MSFEHDKLAHAARVALLSELQSGKAPWRPNRLTTKTTLWHGILDWPQPDGGFQDESTASSLAIEFKPPGHAKREYVTGLGQAHTYLTYFEYALLVVPKHSRDGFEIADFLAKSMEEANDLPVGLITYADDPAKPGALNTLRTIPERATKAPGIPRTSARSVFWAYWRDLSAFDAYQILVLMDRRGWIFEKAFEKYWKKFLSVGKAKDWELKRRKAHSKESRDAERVNTNLSLRQIGAIGSDGGLTERGLKLIQIGKVYGPDSVAFRNLLGQMILLRGRHLDLIFWVEDQQRQLPPDALRRSKAHRKALDKQLQAAGVIPKVPAAKGKETFLRDEFKLWNKLGFLVMYASNQYFHPDRGLIFDWRTIISVTNALDRSEAISLE